MLNSGVKHQKELQFSINGMMKEMKIKEQQEQGGNTLKMF